MSDDRLSSLDATFLQIEDSVAHMHVAGVQIFEGDPPEYVEVLDAIEARLHLVPRYRQKIATVPFGLGRPRWVDDPDFELTYHVRHSALPPPGTHEQLETLVGRVFAQPLDRGRPLWEIWFVEGLADGRFALLTKNHHAMVDGLASVDVLSTLLDDTPETPEHTSRPWSARPAPGPATLLAQAAVERVMLGQVVQTAVQVIRAPQRAAQALAGIGALGLAGLRPAPPSPYNTRIGPNRRFVWRRERLSDLKRIKDALDGSINDVVLTTVAGGIGRHLRRRGEDTDGLELRTFVPVSMRTEEEQGAGGNRVSGFTAALPVGIRDPLERFSAVHETMQALKRSPQAVGADVLVGALGFGPPNVISEASRLGAQQRFANLVVTNVPGPQHALYLLGRELVDIAAMVPLAQNTALGVAVISYHGGVTFGLVGDLRELEDLELLKGDMSESLVELADAAGLALQGDTTYASSQGA